MVGDGGRNAAHHKAVDAFEPMRTENDQIGGPLRGVLDDFRFGIAVLDDLGRFEACFAQPPGGSRDKFFSLLVAVLFNLRGVSRQMREKVSGNVAGNRLDDVEDSNFRSFCAQLLENGSFGLL